MLTVKDVMIKDPITIGGGAAVAEAVVLMREKRIGAVIIEKAGSVEGIFTERDIISRLIGPTGKVDLSAVKIGDVMTRKMITVQSEQDCIELFDSMKKNNIRHLPVVDDGKLAGIISVRDLNDFYNKELEEKVAQIQRMTEDKRRLEEEILRMAEEHRELIDTVLNKVDSSEELNSAIVQRLRKILKKWDKTGREIPADEDESD